MGRSTDIPSRLHMVASSQPAFLKWLMMLGRASAVCGAATSMSTMAPLWTSPITFCVICAAV